MTETASIADLIVTGAVCELCSEPMETEPGHPQKCYECQQMTGEQPKSATSSPFVAMRHLCERADLALVERHFGTHWQIQSRTGATLIDYWPTVGKFRRANAKGGVKAQRGAPEEAVRAAVAIGSCEPKQPGKPQQSEGPTRPDGLPRRDYFAAAALSGLLSKGEYDPSPVAELAWQYADAMLAEREKGRE